MGSDTRESPSRPTVVVAAFDVDNTLTTRDCVIPFLRRVGGGHFVVRLVLHGPRIVVAAAGRRRDRIKVLATRAAVRGRRHDEIAAEARRFAETVWESRMRPDTVARLRWHLDQGHRVVLVSASYRDYLVPLAERLGAHAVLATELEVRDGICTGELRGSNCRAEVKVERLRSWIASEGIMPSEVHAYGDSAGDRDMLAFADHATLVGSTPITVAPVALPSGTSS